LNAADFIGRASAVPSGLIHDSGKQQLRRVEFANREALEPRLLTTCQAAKLRAADVPQTDIDTIRAALAEE